MTIATPRNGEDRFAQYGEEFGMILQELDELRDHLKWMRQFDRVLGHTEMDAQTFHSHCDTAERYQQLARAQLATHATFAMQAPDRDSDSNPVEVSEVLRNVAKAHKATQRANEQAEAHGDHVYPWVGMHDLREEKIEPAVEQADKVEGLLFDYLEERGQSNAAFEAVRAA